MYYSAIGLLAAMVLIIVNSDILFASKASYDKPAWKVYRRFLLAVLIYYLTDILWGVLESRKLSGPLFADTTIYFVAMSISILLWAEYTVQYLDEKNSFGRFLISAGRVIAGLISVLVVVNIFKPVLFTVDGECVYEALTARYVMLSLQILLFILISIYAFLCMFRLGGVTGKFHRYRIIASFGLIMALLLFIQLWFPYLPLYATGYMLGTCLLHAFVANDEKEERKREIEETQKITELKDRFVSLLDNVPGMTFTKDAKTGVYLACNQAFAEYANKEKPEDVVGLTDAQIFDIQTAAHFVEDDRTALSLSKPYIFFENVLDAAGNQKQLQTTKLKYTDTSGRLCILGMCQDVTDMVRIQHEHAMTKEAYENAVNTGHMFTNIAQTLARDYIDLYYVNTDTEEYIEYGKGEENGTISEIRRGWHFFSDCKKELAEKVFEDDRDTFLRAINRKMLMKALDRKDIFIITYRNLSEDGPVYVNMKVSRMEDEKYIIIGITDVDAEMRETIAKNEALKEALSSAANANKSKTEFLSEMSHEIRTPLNAIIGLDTLALKNEKLDGDTRRYLEKIGESAENLLYLINGVIDMSRFKSGRVSLHKEEFSFGAMLEQVNAVIMPRCSEKGLGYSCNVSERVYGNYFGDEMKLREMLVGVLTDAVKCVRAHGSILMNAEKTQEAGGMCTLVFVIRFDGTCDSGSLGMEVTGKIAEMMEGSVNIESKRDTETEITMTVKLENCEIKDTDRQEKINPENMHVLVVDDDPIEAEHARLVLEEAGIRTDFCTSGQEALQMMEIKHAAQKPYNLVLMDWNMPGMNGMETSAEIRKLYSDECIVVAMTAYNWDDIHDEAKSAGVDNYLAKPLFSVNIVDNLEKIARRSRLDVFREKRQANLSGRRILLAEDMAINAEIMMDTLELENIKADHAENGKAALEMFKKSTAGVYAAILMDVRMPVMDGLEAARAIRALDREDAKKIPIIALTANTFDEDIQYSVQAGMNAHLSKPVEAEQLIKVLGELVYEAEK